MNENKQSNMMLEKLIDRFDAKIYGGGITMAKEYIEREAVKRELLSWAVSINHPEYLIKDDALHIIASIPAADVVEVVRCRDCKYHEDTHVTGFEHCCLYDLTMRHNDFCSYGKRDGGSDND